MADPVVIIEKVSLKYKKTVLTDVNITAGKGEVIGLLGLNGSGKSTLLTAIAGLRKPASGNIKVNGKPGFVTQENALTLPPPACPLHTLSFCLCQSFPGTVSRAP